MTNTPIVLLSINPKWATAILAQNKQYEYRKQPPARDPPYRVILYASAPTKAIVGEVQVDTALSEPVDTLIDQTIAETPHETSDIQTYFDGHSTGTALSVTEPVRYSDEIPLSVLREHGISPPQNFQYLRPDDNAALLDQLSSRQ